MRAKLAKQGAKCHYCPDQALVQLSDGTPLCAVHTVELGSDLHSIIVEFHARLEEVAKQLPLNIPPEGR